MSKKLKNYSLILVFLFTILGTIFPVSTSFTEIRDYENHWAKNSIERIMEKGIISGYPDGSFKPDNPITRAEFFTIVNKAFNFTGLMDRTYVDVPVEKWYAKEVSKGAKAGYIKPYGNGTIEPEREIRREEVADIIAKIKNLKSNAKKSNFKDIYEGTTKYPNAINAMFDCGIIKGYTDGTFRPKEKITRAEAVIVLLNTLNYKILEETTSEVKIYDEEDTYGLKSEVETIDGDVVISHSGVKLQNMIIKGNLTVTKEVGDGDATLENVKVEGETFINGGGSNSIHLIDSILGKVYVEKKGAAVRIVASGKTDVDNLIVKSEVKLEELLIEDKGFENIFVEENNERIMLTLIDTVCSNLELKCKGAILNTTASSKISDLNIQGANVKIIGKGKIESAKIKASGAVFDSKPVKMTVDKGIKKPTIKIIQTQASGGSSGGSSGGGSGGGSGGSSGKSSSSSSGNRVKTVKLSKDEMILFAGGKKGVVRATIEPKNASNKNLKWVTNNSNIATVSDGVITPISSGVAVITVITDDKSREDTVIVRVLEEVETNNIADLSNALNASGVKKVILTSNIKGDINVNRTSSTDLEIDFGKYDLRGNLNIIANELSYLYLNGIDDGYSIFGNLTVEAENGTVNNNINVIKNINIKAISNNTWNQNGDAEEIEITADGGSFAYLSGNFDNGIILKPARNTRPINLYGDLSLIPFSVEKPVKLEIKKTAMPPIIEVKNGANGTEIDNFSEISAKIKANVDTFVSGNMMDMGGKVKLKKKLKMPTLNPYGGMIPSGSKIEILAENDCDIFYTLDGSNPEPRETLSTKKYSEKILFNEAMTIKAIAVKNGYKSSKITIGKYVRAGSANIKSIDISKYPNDKDIRIGDTLTIDKIGMSDGNSPEGRVQYFAEVKKSASSTEVIGKIKIDSSENSMVIPETYEDYSGVEKSLLGKYLDFGAMIYGLEKTKVKNTFGAVKNKTDSGDIPVVSRVRGSTENNVEVLIDFDGDYGVDKETAEDISNYMLNDLEILDARATYQKRDEKKYYNRVILTTSYQLSKSYKLKVKNVCDGSRFKMPMKETEWIVFSPGVRDLKAPKVYNIVVKTWNEIDVVFKEANSLDLNTALDISNYKFEDDDLDVLEVKLKDENQNQINYYNCFDSYDDRYHGYERDEIAVTLKVSTMKARESYKLIVSNIADNFGNAIERQEINTFRIPSKVEKPSIIRDVEIIDLENIFIWLDNPIKKEDAENINNYFISGGIGTPIIAELFNSYQLLWLKVPKLNDKYLYEITVNNIENFAGYITKDYKKEFLSGMPAIKIEEISNEYLNKIYIYFNQELAKPGKFEIKEVYTNNLIENKAEILDGGHVLKLLIPEENSLKLNYRYELKIIESPENKFGDIFEEYENYIYNFKGYDPFFPDEYRVFNYGDLFDTRNYRPNEIYIDKLSSKNFYTSDDLEKAKFMTEKIDKYANAYSYIDDGEIVIKLNPQFAMVKDREYVVSVDGIESEPFRGSIIPESVVSTTGAGTSRFSVEIPNASWSPYYKIGAGFVEVNENVGNNTPFTKVNVSTSSVDDDIFEVTGTTFNKGDKLVIYEFDDYGDGIKGNDFQVKNDRINWVSEVIEVK